MEERIRAFIGVDIPDMSLVAKMMGVQAQLAATEADIKLVERQNFHVTMRFLGDIDHGTADVIGRDVLQGVDMRSFQAQLRGVGVFPKLEYPRVVWMGIAQGAEELKVIYRTVESKLRGIGFRPEREDYTPHITLARVRSGRNKQALIGKVRELEDVEVGAYEVKAVQLKKSVLTPQGPIYSTVAEVRTV